MVTIRLARIGKRKHPTYRLVASDKRKDTLGPFIEQLGTYDPHPAEGGVKLNAERITYWLGIGATVSPSVHNILVSAKVIEGKTVPLGMAKKAEAAPEAKAAEEKPAEAPTTTKPEASKKDEAPAA
jgi:small subunit ribosomal protein S16